MVGYFHYISVVLLDIQWFFFFFYSPHSNLFNIEYFGSLYQCSQCTFLCSGKQLSLSPHATVCSSYNLGTVIQELLSIFGFGDITDHSLLSPYNFPLMSF